MISVGVPLMQPTLEKHITKYSGNSLFNKKIVKLGQKPYSHYIIREVMRPADITQQNEELFCVGTLIS